jgi:hypothetical protein
MHLFFGSEEVIKRVKLVINSLALPYFNFRSQLMAYKMLTRNITEISSGHKSFYSIVLPMTLLRNDWSAKMWRKGPKQLRIRVKRIGLKDEKKQGIVHKWHHVLKRTRFFATWKVQGFPPKDFRDNGTWKSGIL